MAVAMRRPREHVESWQRAYQRNLGISDQVIILATVLAVQFVTLGDEYPEPELGIDGNWWGFTISYTLFSVLLSGLWILALQYTNSRDHRITGIGLAEYKGVIDGTFRAFGLVAIGSLLLRSEISRSYLLIAFPLGLALLLLSRLLWRKWLHGERAQNRFLYRTVMVGQPDNVDHVVSQICRYPKFGYRVVGAVTEGSIRRHDAVGIVRHPVPGSIEPIVELVDQSDADTLMLTSSTDMEPSEVRRLGWAMHERGVDMIVAPALTDIAGPRIHTRPVAGLPLIHIEYPELHGKNYWLKRGFDVVGSLVLITLLSPVLLAVAAIIKIMSPGPVLFVQERIGQNGVPFRMYKFRSMVVNADAQLGALLRDQGSDGKPLFKVDNDPRITPIGRFIRKYSIDELPQLFNSLMGSMSLVGPRPQVSGEVALYDSAAFRRLMVKPGLTGLWQVSGRSDLSWEDAIRLDLFYVENWSMVGDLVILWRTLGAVMKPQGAV